MLDKIINKLEIQLLIIIIKLIFLEFKNQKINIKQTKI